MDNQQEKIVISIQFTCSRQVSFHINVVKFYIKKAVSKSYHLI